MPKLAESARNEKRQALIEAAWRCASRKGFQATTVDDVCAEARVSKGAFYVYFDQKQQLLLALIDDDARFYETLIDRLSTTASSTGIERLRSYARAVAERSSDSARVQLTADLWAEMLSQPEVRERFAARVQARRDSIRKWIDNSIAGGEMASIPANAFASILLALTDGLLLHGSLQPSAFRWTNIQRALDVLFEGIST